MLKHSQVMELVGKNQRVIYHGVGGDFLGTIIGVDTGGKLHIVFGEANLYFSPSALEDGTLTLANHKASLYRAAFLAVKAYLDTDLDLTWQDFADTAENTELMLNAGATLDELITDLFGA